MLILLTLLAPASAGGLNIQVNDDRSVVVTSQSRECDCDNDPQVPHCGRNEVPPSGIPCPDGAAPTVLQIDTDQPGPIWQPGAWLTLSVGLDESGELHVVMGNELPKMRRGSFTELKALPEEQSAAYLDRNLVLDASTGRLLIDTGIQRDAATFKGRVIATPNTLMLSPADGRMLEVSPAVLDAAGVLRVAPDSQDAVEAAGAAEGTTPVVQP